MQKVTININTDQWRILRQIAKNLGIPISTLIQQEIDRAMETADVWLQRADMVYVR
jgi:hypothetical protein